MRCLAPGEAGLERRYDLSRSELPAQVVAELQKLNRVNGVAASVMPQAMIVKVNGHGLLSVLSNSAYTNIASMFNEDNAACQRRIV